MSRTLSSPLSPLSLSLSLLALALVGCGGKSDEAASDEGGDGAADGAGDGAADGAADGGAADGGTADGGAGDGAADGGSGDGAADGASDGGAADGASDGGGDGSSGHPFTGAQPVTGRVDLVLIELEVFDGCVINDGDVVVDAEGGLSFSVECRGFALVPGGALVITGTGAFDSETTAVGTFSAVPWALDVPFTMSFSSPTPPADIRLEERVSGYYSEGRVNYSGWFILGEGE